MNWFSDGRTGDAEIIVHLCHLLMSNRRGMSTKASEQGPAVKTCSS